LICSMHTRAVTFAMSSMLMCMLPGDSFAGETVQVELGSHRLLRRAQPIDRIAIGNPDVADVEPVSEREILLLGKSSGSTSLILWHGDTSEELEIVVRGSSTGSTKDALSTLDEPELRRGAAGGLAGRAHSLPGLAAARELTTTQRSGPDTSELAFDTQVQIDIKVVEVSRQLLRQIGVQLLRNTDGSAHALSPPGTLAGIAGEGAAVKDMFNGFIFGSTSGFLPLSNAFQIVAANSNSGFVGIVSLLEANGFAQTLAEPTLVTTSGQTASFLAGGEFPIPVAQGGNGDGSSISIEYREFGIRLTLRPTVLSRDHIVVKVAPEVSDLDFSAGISIGGVSVPALTTRRAETTVALGDGESFVIGGLISRNLSGSVERIPGLGSLPVIGAFFRRTSYQREDRELIMIVSPRLVRPLARGAATPPLPGSDTLGFEPSNLQLIFEGRGVPPPGGTGFAE